MEVEWIDGGVNGHRVCNDSNDVDSNKSIDNITLELATCVISMIEVRQERQINGGRGVNWS